MDIFHVVMNLCTVTKRDYISIITLLPFFIKMLQYDWLCNKTTKKCIQFLYNLEIDYQIKVVRGFFFFFLEKRIMKLITGINILLKDLRVFINEANHLYWQDTVYRTESERYLQTSDFRFRTSHFHNISDRSVKVSFP